jgi:hypothetical protein
LAVLFRCPGDAAAAIAALNGFLGRSLLRVSGQFTPQIIETFVHQLRDMKAVESQNRVWRVGSHAAGICSAHVHGHRFEPSSAELEAALELTQSLCPAAFPHPAIRALSMSMTSVMYFRAPQIEFIMAIWRTLRYPMRR